MPGEAQSRLYFCFARSFKNVGRCKLPLHAPIIWESEVNATQMGLKTFPRSCPRTSKTVVCISVVSETGAAVRNRQKTRASRKKVTQLLIRRGEGRCRGSALARRAPDRLGRQYKLGGAAGGKVQQSVQYDSTRQVLDEYSTVEYCTVLYRM